MSGLCTRLTVACIACNHQIFYWDASQFQASVLQFLAPFAPAGNGSYLLAHENELQVSYFPYDWARNGV